MNKVTCLLALLSAGFSLRCAAAVPRGCADSTSSALTAVPEQATPVPDDAIPFISDGHIHLQATLNDTVPVTLVYDTGADHLYLDEDYLELGNMQTAFGRKTKARIGGA